jgi:mRNA interferase MazF
MPERGDIWWCEVPEIAARPVVVLSRNRSITARRRAIVAACSTHVRGLDTEVVLEPPDDRVPRRSAVALDGVTDVSVATLVERVGALSEERMREICTALAVAVSCA